ncbi:MAG: hypothetical protein R6V56_04845 [Lentisphaeria bacterium]
MQEWAENLLKLQENDLRMDKLQQQIDTVPKEKAEAQQLLQNELDALQSARNHVQELQKAIKNVEIDIDSNKEKQRDFEKKSTMIKDNNDYRAALQQIDTCKTKISNLEDQQLEYMQELEEAREKAAKENKAKEVAEKRVNDMLSDLDKRAQKCEEQISKLRERSEELAAQVPSQPLRKYKRLRTSRLNNNSNPEVFVEVKDTTCMSCHMNVPPQVKTNARKGMLEQCPQCNAMLYA